MLFKIVLFNLITCVRDVVGLIMETEKFDDFYREYSIWVAKYRSVDIIFCHVEPSNSFIRTLMVHGMPVKMDVVTQHSDTNIYQNILVLGSLGDRKSSKDCISSNIPTQSLLHSTKLVIYDLSGKNSTVVNDIGESLNFLGSANVLYRSGKACWQCSAPYILRRSFSRPERCSGSSWPTHAETPLDLLGQTLEVISFHHPLSSIVHFNESDPNKRYDGIEMKIFFQVANLLNFSWTFNELPNEKDKWGQFINGSWKGGIVEALVTGKADVGFCNLWMSPFHIPFIEFTSSWTTVELVFLVPKPSQVAVSWRSMFKPFSITVWTVTALTIIVFPIVAWTTTRLFHMLYSPCSERWSLSSYIFYTLGMLTGGSGYLTERLPLRHLSFSWAVFILLLTNTYTSNIVADLSLPAHTPPFDTVRQLVEHNFSWGLIRPQYSIGQLLNLQKYWHKQFAEKFIVYNNTDQRQLLMQKNFALMAQRLEGTNFLIVDIEVDDDVAEFLTIMKEQILNYRSAITLRKNSPLLASFNTALQRLIQSGLVQHYKRDTELRYQNLPHPKIFQNVNTKHFPFAPISLVNYKTIFFTLLLGWMLSVITFLIEI